MQDLDLKKKVINEIMSLMDEKDGERLKSHPKLMAAKVSVEKKDPMEALGEESEEMPEGEEELSPEMIKQLLEMMNGQ